VLSLLIFYVHMFTFNLISLDINPSINTNSDGAPPPYTDSPPPYEGVEGVPNMAVQAPPPGVMGEPTVVCRVCQQLIFIRGREGQRVVKCSNCHEATVIVIHKIIYINFQIELLFSLIFYY